MNQYSTIHSSHDLAPYTEQLIASIPQQDRAAIITLSGDLGAGKTTLAQHLARGLGVTEEVSSPTFVIAKYYDLANQPWDRLIHIDAYRLEDEPLEPLGFAELFENPNNLIVIEWPEYIQSVLPTGCTAISIAINPDESRTITIT